MLQVAADCAKEAFEFGLRKVKVFVKVLVQVENCYQKYP